MNPNLTQDIDPHNPSQNLTFTWVIVGIKGITDNL